MARAAIFIDGAYLDFGLRDEFHRVKIDYHALARELTAGKELLRTYYYNCLP
jgi:hypothetical protein